MRKRNKKTAAELHENVPADWYFASIRDNIFQRYWHRRRFTEIKRLVTPVAGMILDIGSNDGTFTNFIYQNTHPKRIVGIDVLKSSVDWANKKWGENKKIQFRVVDAHNLPFKAQEFDAVFSLEMLEHVYDPQKVLREARRVLKKGGYGVFLVPTDNALFKIVWYLWGHYRGKIWKDTHIQSFQHSSLEDAVKKAGFTVDKSRKFLLGMLHAVRVKK